MTVFVFNKREMSSATSSLQSRSGTLCENNPNGYLFLNKPVDGGGGDEINT